MSPTLVGSAEGPPDVAIASRPPDVSVRALLGNYAITLVVPLLGLIALLIAWTPAAAAGWPAAVTAVGVWAAATAVWLRGRAWRAALVHLVSWGAPAALLVPSAAAGLLSAEGLVLWAPVTTVLTVCLVLTYQPRPVNGRRRHTG